MTAALASWQLLAWDTQFFGFKTARIVAESLDAARIDQICQQCQHAGVQVVYYTVPASDDQRMRLAEMQGFDLVDIRMTFEWVVGPISTQTPSTNLLIRSARPDDLARHRVQKETEQYDHDQGKNQQGVLNTGADVLAGLKFLLVSRMLGHFSLFLK